MGGGGDCEKKTIIDENRTWSNANNHEEEHDVSSFLKGAYFTKENILGKDGTCNNCLCNTQLSAIRDGEIRINNYEFNKLISISTEAKTDNKKVFI